MPLLKLETTVVLPDEKRQALLATLSSIVTETIGKPEKFVMVTVDAADIMMSAELKEAALVEIRSIGGLDVEVNRQLSQRICDALTEMLGIEQNRIYLNFTDVAPGNWGWKGSTFG